MYIAPSARAMPRAHSKSPDIVANFAKRSNVINCPDMIALVGYGDTAAVLSSFVSAFDDSFSRAVNGLPQRIKGTTNIASALRTANNLLVNAPRGLRRRVWLLTDGDDNVETDKVMGEVARAEANRININTIGFGTSSSINPNRLRAISGGTRTGKYVPAETAQKLGDVLKNSEQRPTQRQHQGEATVFCIDLSGSMSENMGSKTKIEVVRDTMFDLIRYKQMIWS